MSPICVLGAALSTALLGAGCRTEPPTPVAASTEAETSALLALIPPELRFKPPVDDPAAKARYVSIKRHVDKDPLARHGYFWYDTLPCTPRTIAVIREVMKAGPVQVDEAEDLDEAMNRRRLNFNPGLLLGVSGLIELRAGRKEQGIADLILVVNWHMQTKGPYYGGSAMGLDQRRPLAEAMTMPELTRAEKLRIVDAFWTESELTEIKKNLQKRNLERKVRELARLSAPRRDMVVSRHGFHKLGEEGVSRALTHPYVAVPPHGTLNRAETVPPLVDQAKWAISLMDPPKIVSLPIARPSLSRFIKWLPAKPSKLLDVADKDMKEKKAEVHAYVEEMNKGHNTLGRELVGRESFLLLGFQTEQEKLKESFRQLVNETSTVHAPPEKGDSGKKRR